MMYREFSKLYVKMRNNHPVSYGEQTLQVKRTAKQKWKVKTKEIMEVLEVINIKSVSSYVENIPCRKMTLAAASKICGTPVCTFHS